MGQGIVAKFRQKLVVIPAWMIVLLPLALTLIATYASYQKTLANQRTQVELIATRLNNAIHDRMQVYLNALRHTRSFFLATGDVTREEFEIFVSSLDLKDRYAGLQGIGFTKFIPKEELDEHIQAVRAEGFETYKVWPEFERDEYHAIVYLEPFDERNRRAFGFDMYTQPNRRLAMAQARDTGFTTLTKQVVLVQETEQDPQKGFLIYTPLYHHGAPLATTEQRRAALRGFIYSPFRAPDLFGEVLKEVNRRGDELIFEVYDGTDRSREGLLYSPFSDPISLGRAERVYWIPFEIAGHRWTIAFSPMATGTGFILPGLHWVIFIAGIIFCLFVYFYWRLAHEYTGHLSKSENLLKLIIDALPWRVSYLDSAQRILFHNREHAKSLDAELSRDIRGSSLVEVKGIEQYQGILPYLTRAMGGERQSFETSIKENTGETRDFHVEYVPDTRGGKLHGVVMLEADITEEKNSKVQLLEEQRISEIVIDVGLSLRGELNLEALVDRITELATSLTHAEFGVFFYHTVDKKGERRILNTTSGNAKEHFNSITNKGAMAIVAGAFNSSSILRSPDIKTDESLKGSGYFAYLPNQMRSYLAVPVVSRSGEVLGGLLFGHSQPDYFTARTEKLIDGIAVQASVAIDNAKLYQEAQMINQMKDEFVATLSHELRTPLNVILGHTEIIKEEGLNYERLEESVNAIHRNAVAQHQIVSDLLDVSAVLSGKITFHPAKLEIDDILESAIDSVKVLAQSKKIQIEYTNDSNLKYIIADPTRMQQVIWNLLSNAIKFTPEGGQVQVVCQKVESSIEISVTDNGIGMDADLLPHIFERFRQADSSFTRSFGGLGLGLSIVHHLVELHGGKIEAYSEGRGKGSKFTLRLPIPALELQDDLEVKASDRSSSPSHVNPNLIRGRKVLALDDDPDARQLLGLILKRSGAEYTMVGSADEALDVLKREQFDVIVSDIGMPEKDGFSFMQEYRSHEAIHSSFTPAIALTAFARAEEGRRAFAVGFQRHLAKPVNSRALINAIADLTAKSEPS